MAKLINITYKEYIMSDQTTRRAAQGQWLSDSEREFCQQIAAGGESLHRQRATALLGLDSGKTYAQAAEMVGLSMGQLKYCVTAFRNKRLDIFPQFEAVVSQPEPAEAVAEPEPVDPVAVAEPSTDTKKKKSKKKDKKKADKKKSDKEKERSKAKKSKKKKNVNKEKKKTKKKKKK
jgi:hypothetical protein